MTWKKEFSWLEYDKSLNVMKCATCTKDSLRSSSNSREKNASVSGVWNFQKSALVRHEKSADRIIAEAAASGKEEMAVGATGPQQMNSRARYTQVGAAMILAQDDLPYTKLSSLLRAQGRVHFSTRPVIRFSQIIWYFGELFVK